MISLPLFKRNMAASVKVMALIYALLTMYNAVIIYMYDPKLSDMLTGYQDVLPQMMSAVGMTGIATNLLEFTHIYLYGFFMLIFPILFSIIEVNKMLTKYLDSGSFANLLSTPNSRMKILRTQWLSIMLSLTILIAASTATGLACSALMFPGELAAGRYIELNLALLLAQCCVTSIIFLAACVFHEAKRFYLFGAGIPILFFLFKMLSNMGEELDWMKYLTLFTLFPSDEIVSGHGAAAGGMIALALMTAGFSAIGFLYFKKKDLPL